MCAINLVKKDVCNQSNKVVCKLSPGFIELRFQWILKDFLRINKSCGIQSKLL